MRYARIDSNDLVIQILIAEPEWILEQTDGMRYVEAEGVTVDEGWTWPEGEDPTPPVPDVDELREELRTLLYRRARDFLDEKIADRFSDAERGDWPQLEAECRDYLDTAAIGPALERRQAAGLPLTGYCNYFIGVLDRARDWIVKAEKKRYEIETALDAAATVEALLAVGEQITGGRSAQ